jgi:GDP-L-fucose synthase
MRKLHIGKCLVNGDIDAIRQDLNKYPIEGVNGSKPEAEILGILSKYGIRKEDGQVYVQFWGTGTPRREFLHSEDLADACLYIFENLDFPDLIQDKEMLNAEVKNIKNTHINIGTGTDISIKELVQVLSDITEYKGNIEWDTTRPDGTSQKLMDVGKLNSLGWREKFSLKEGLAKFYSWYLG